MIHYLEGMVVSNPHQVRDSHHQQLRDKQHAETEAKENRSDTIQSKTSAKMIGKLGTTVIQCRGDFSCIGNWLVLQSAQ